MAISQETRNTIYKRAGGQCECTMQCSHHAGKRCTHSLGTGWEAHHKVAVSSGGSDAPSNLTAMCATCHKNTRTYGKH